MNQWTVVFCTLDPGDCYVMHVTAPDPKAAYHTALEELHAECFGSEGETVGFDGEPCPFDYEQAKKDRPPLAVFRGHHETVSVSDF